MCTVTYISTQNGVCITSNRDEKQTRLPAVMPHHYLHNGTALLYPKDATAGGTWMAAKPNGDTAVLLNGGFVPHIPQPPYRHSRGRVIVDILLKPNPILALHHYNCKGLEPFTLILFAANSLYECRWTGNLKHISELDTQGSYIWSSATLYGPAVVAKRNSWFNDWITAYPQPAQEQVLQFHRFAGDGDAANDLCMNRSGETLTVSITSVLINRQQLQMTYHDTTTETLHTIDTSLALKNVPDFMIDNIQQLQG